MNILWKDPESCVEIIKKGDFFISESNKNIEFLIKFLDLLIKKIILTHLEYNGTILKKPS